MTKNIFISILLMLCFSTSIHAQSGAGAQDKKRIAVFITGNADETAKRVFSNELKSALLRTQKYIVAAREDQFLELLQKEQSYQQGGRVADNQQLTDWASQFGVDILCIGEMSFSQGLNTASAQLLLIRENVYTGEINPVYDYSSRISGEPLVKLCQAAAANLARESSEGRPSATLTLFDQNGKSDQDKKRIAVFITGNANEITKQVFSNELKSSLLRTQKYIVAAREDQFLELLRKEQSYQQGGRVADSQQLSDWAAQFGVDILCIGDMTLTQGLNTASAQLLMIRENVYTGEITPVYDFSYTLAGQQIVDFCKAAVAKLADEPVTAAKPPEKNVSQPARPAKQPVVEEKPVAKPVITYDMLVAEKRTVLQNGRELSQNEVQRLMANTESLRLYNNGLAKNKKGDFCFFTGIFLIAGGSLVAVAQPFEWRYEYTENGNPYYGYKDEKLNYAIGGGLAAAGVVMMISGVTIKSTSVKFIRKSVDLYNMSKTTSNLELKFDLTGNGVRLALKF